MTITNIEDARRRRDERREQIDAATRWAFEVLPFSATVLDTEFRDHWPNLTTQDRAEVAVGLQLLVEEYQSAALAPEMDYDRLMTRLRGREVWWSRLASWIQNHGPAADFSSDEFTQCFGEISRSELIKGMVEARLRMSLPK